MKKLFHITLCLCLYLMAATALAASSVDDSGLIVLSVTADNASVRAAPDAESGMVGGLQSGAVVVAEKWPIQGSSTSWYRIVALADPKTGSVSDMLQSFPKAESNTYVSAERVQPYSGMLSATDIIERVRATPYGMGYGALDASAANQRRMAEEGTLKWAFPPATGASIPVYAQADADSKMLGHYSENDWQLVAVDDSRPGWLLVVDLTGERPSGWVQTDQLELAPRDTTSYAREPGYLVTLNLGANVPEIMRRWGPATVAERRAERQGEECFSVQTVITAEGFELTFADYRNFTFTLTRPGAGMGGIFVDTGWCNKTYIESVFGKSSPLQFISDGGIERCVIEGGPDGWNFSIHLEFDPKGLINKFIYQCGDVNLN